MLAVPQPRSDCIVDAEGGGNDGDCGLDGCGGDDAGGIGGVSGGNLRAVLSPSACILLKLITIA